MSQSIICIFGGVVGIVLETIGDYLTIQSLGNHLILWCICIDDQKYLLWKKLRKLPERITNVIDIFEEIEMICIPYSRIETIFGKKLKKLLVYSQASVIKCRNCTRILP